MVNPVGMDYNISCCPCALAKPTAGENVFSSHLGFPLLELRDNRTNCLPVITQTSTQKLSASLMTFKSFKVSRQFTDAFRETDKSLSTVMIIRFLNKIKISVKI